jgi:glycosyltransferase involved in cell wall biosynthesis/ubiquinone/menaquinone biosynthesis C-methylase UbiE
VVVPSDPLDDYAATGYGSLEHYYNPEHFFTEVVAVSPRETGRRRAHGMTVIGVAESEFAAAVREIAPDVVRAYGGYWPADLVTRHRIDGVPVVVSVHDSHPDKVHESLRYADLVLVTSEIVRRRVLDRGVDPARVRRLPNRVDRTVFRPRERGRLRELWSDAPGGRLILHVGRRTAQKNLDTVIRALARLGSDYSGVFVGSGDDAPYRALAAQLGVADRCRWVDAVPNEELPVWYSGCDAFCVPSRWEGFGIVFIEAAACAAAIVTSDLAPMNEYLAPGASASLVRAHEDAGALAAALQRVCTDADYRATIRAGAVRVAERFDRRVVDAMEVAIYRELLAGPEPGFTRRLVQAAWPVQARVRDAVRDVVPAPLTAHAHGLLAHLTAPTSPSTTALDGATPIVDRRPPTLARAVARVAPSRGPFTERWQRRGQPGPLRALRWVREHELPGGGIRVHSSHPDAYPEVSGYLVPTLLACGERALARRLVRWLCCIQRAEGSFAGPDGIARVFDTAQALRGLLAGASLEPVALACAQRAADYLCDEMIDGGRGGFGKRYSDEIPESVHLYALPPLVAAATMLDEPRYRAAAERCLSAYVDGEDRIATDDLTHFLAYRLEALIEMGREDLARPALAALRERQAADGSVPGRPDVRWVCTPGLAQIAICWYRIGEHEAADRALAWLEARQTPQGGFRGSEGPGAAYFADTEPSWAVKFYLDAHRLRLSTFMGRAATAMPSSVSSDDGRAAALLALVRPGDRVIEVGCGKGRFLEAVRRRIPDARCVGVDLAAPMLAAAAEGTGRVQGRLESVPARDDRFDVVFAVEAVAHAEDTGIAVDELARIARPGGWVVIVDKQRRHWGRLSCPPWESWPETEALARQLRRHCDEVSWEAVAYDDHPADGLMVAWRGRKRARLGGDAWNRVLVPAERRRVVETIQKNRVSPWAAEVALATRPGERVLEIGSGTGEMSLALALGGRRVAVLDVSVESLGFTRACAGDLGLDVRAVCADALQPLPFGDRSFDCVWSSGLLEHFSAEERRAMLRDWARVSRRLVVSLVPNASSVAYRAGKSLAEASGTWRYGHEQPIASLRDDCEAAGLVIVAERSVGAHHALEFLPRRHPLRRALAEWLPRSPEEPPGDPGQGYMLVTVAARRDSC